MRRRAWRVIGALALGAVLPMAALAAARPGSAAHLEIDGGVAQYWEFTVDPRAPHEPMNGHAGDGDGNGGPLAAPTSLE